MVLTTWSLGQVDQGATGQQEAEFDAFPDLSWTWVPHCFEQGRGAFSFHNGGASIIRKGFGGGVCYKNVTIKEPSTTQASLLLTCSRKEPTCLGFLAKISLYVCMYVYIYI